MILPSSSSFLHRGGLLLVSLLVALASAAERKPNLVLILADDFGYEAVTANGGQSYRTPNIDRLAAGGMRFEHCHVQPLCTPTRVQLMTGIYNIRNYVDFQLMDPKVTTFGQLLKTAGYTTAIAGKWQLGTDPKGPKQLGFDESVLWQLTRRPPRYANPGLEINGVEKDYDNGEYGPTLINDFALDFITRHKDHPFFLYYPMILTHDPFQPTPDSKDWDPKAKGETTSFSKEKVNLNVKYFADMTAYMDKMVGRVIAKLDELGLRENTLVIFLGDNGTDVDVTSRFKGKPYRGGKGTRTARATHVPLVASWPGHIEAGKVNSDLIGSVDFLPTLCEAGGAAAPASLKIDGRSFLPQLLGQNGNPRDWLYVWYARYGGPTAMFEFAMTRQHKLYRDGTFFDLEADPFEEKPPLKVANLSGAQAVAAKKLQAALDQYTNARPPHLMQHTERSKRDAR
jgi:arylsulfatase A